MSNTTKERLGFHFQVEVWPETTATPATQFTRAIEDFATEQDFLIHGTPLQGCIEGRDRDVSLTDQVNLIDWLVNQPTVRAVQVSPLTGALDDPGRWDGGTLRVPVLDMRVIAVCLLHRLGHLRPLQYIEILGGYVRRVH